MAILGRGLAGGRLGGHDCGREGAGASSAGVCRGGDGDDDAGKYCGDAGVIGAVAASADTRADTGYPVVDTECATLVADGEIPVLNWLSLLFFFFWLFFGWFSFPVLCVSHELWGIGPVCIKHF